MLWQPSSQRLADANLMAFLREIGQPNYRSLYQWSIDHPLDFWPAVWRFTGVQASCLWDDVLLDGDRMPGARWFPGARLNFAENLLRDRDERIALVFWNEQGRQRQMTFAELYAQVARLADALRRQGVTVGDRVAGFLPNLPETIVAMLATTSLGAIWSSCSPDFGLEGILDRFGQIEPKVLLAADAYLYNGREHDCLTRVRHVAEQIGSITRTVVIPYRSPAPDLVGFKNGVLWDDFLAPGGSSTPAIDFAQLPFDHPLYILYSSGTTGKPKCIVHGAGGTLLQHAKELVLHTDLKRDDRLFYFTTCGWMMWNWLVSGLSVGATLILFDGSPFAPHEQILFEMAEQERINIFGTSAKYLSALEKCGAEPAKTRDLSALRTTLSTGSPLASESYDYVYRDVKSDVCLSSISGGTDIVSCFALGNPIGPVYRGELQTRGLGMKVEVFDDAGQPVIGQKGELVCTAPFPSMPVGFWNDPDGAKYHEAYFSHYPNIWRHGDYAELVPHADGAEGVVIYGRSDATLNPGGVRIGTAEIYRQVEQLPEVLESLVVGQNWQGDVRIVLFVKLRPGAALDVALVERICQGIRAGTTPRHVPARVLAVPDIPRTKSGKIVELAVRETIHGRPVKNLEALDNPEALAGFRDRPELAH